MLGTKDAIHDVPVDAIGTGTFQRHAFLAQAGEIGGQNGGGDLDWSCHERDPNRGGRRYRSLVELRVTATARDGAGVARAEDGRVVFVEGALPGETVVAEITRVDKRWSRGRVVTVQEPSPDRIPVPCAHQLEGCGGCDLLHVAPSAAMRMKQSMVVDQLTRGRGGGTDAVHTAHSTTIMDAPPCGLPSYQGGPATACGPPTT